MHAHSLAVGLAAAASTRTTPARAPRLPAEVKPETTPPEPILLSTQEAAALIGRHPSFLERARAAHNAGRPSFGPPWVRLGSASNARVAYLRESLLNWLKQQEQGGPQP